MIVSNSLRTIDAKPIQPQQRQFLLQLRIRRLKSQIREDEKLAAEHSSNYSGSQHDSSPTGAASISGSHWPENIHHSASFSSNAPEGQDLMPPSASSPDPFAMHSQHRQQQMRGPGASQSGSLDSQGRYGPMVVAGGRHAALGEFGPPPLALKKAAPPQPPQPRQVAVQQLQLQLGNLGKKK